LKSLRKVGKQTVFIKCVYFEVLQTQKMKKCVSVAMVMLSIGCNEYCRRI